MLWTISTNKAKGVVLQPPLSSSRHDIHVRAAFVLVGKSSVRLGRDADDFQLISLSSLRCDTIQGLSVLYVNTHGRTCEIGRIF